MVYVDFKMDNVGAKAARLIVERTMLEYEFDDSVKVVSCEEINDEGDTAEYHAVIESPVVSDDDLTDWLFNELAYNIPQIFDFDVTETGRVKENA